jgi:pilus assembly protein CpaE
LGFVIICDPDTEFSTRLGQLVSGNAGVEVKQVASPNDAAALALENGAHVVAFGPSADQAASLEAGRQLAVSSPRVASLLLAPKVEAELLRTAMRSGFRDVVEVGDSTYGAVAEAIADAYSAAAQLRGASEAVNPADARVITVFSTKGGVGKSVIASNLDVVLASELGKRVALLDLDLESGDDALMLGLEPSRTIFDAVQAFDRLDAQLLDGFMRRHTSGAKVLLAPTQPEQAESVTNARVGKVIDLAKELAEVVVIDTAGRLDETVLTAIDKSDLVLAVATMDLPSIKNTKVSLQKLRQLGYRNGMVSLVLNRADSKVFLDPSEVERAVGGKVLAKIPSDRLVPRSVNRGIPVALDQPKSPVAKSMINLAKLVV